MYCRKKAGYRAVSYGDLHERVVRTGNYLRAKGLGRGDRVVVALGARPEWTVYFLAIQYVGAVCVPIDNGAGEADAEKIMGIARPRFAVVVGRSWSFLEASRSGNDRPVQVIRIDDDGVRSDIARETADESFEDSGSGSDVAAIFFTSGTTGAPKGVMLSHKNLLANASSILDFQDLRCDDVFIALLPPHHTYAVMATVIVPLVKGAATSYPPRIASKDIMECLKETGVTIMTGVPQLFLLLHKEISRKMGELPERKRRVLEKMLRMSRWVRERWGLNMARMVLGKAHQTFGKRLRFMVSGGAHLDAAVADDYYSWGFTVLEGYGLTETSPIAAMNPPNRQKSGSVGKPVTGVEIRIEAADRNGVGEILIKGDNVMRGYFEMPDKTAMVLAGGWFRTGDLGRFDEDRYLYIVGRKDDMINLSSGEKVHPETIESRYLKSPVIQEICIFPVRGAGYIGTAMSLAAVVVPDERHLRSRRGAQDPRGIIQKEIERIAKESGPAMSVSGFVIATEELPRTALGKIMRYKACDYYARNAAKKQQERKRPLSADDARLMREPMMTKVMNFLSKRLGREIGLDDHLEIDLGIDSLSKVELLLEVQDLLGVQIPESQLESFFYASTVRDLYAQAKKHLPDETGHKTTK